MPTIPVKTSYDPRDGSFLAEWQNMANGDDGAPIIAKGYKLVSLHWFGTPGAGFDGAIEVSNEGAPANWQEVTAIAATGEEFAQVDPPLSAQYVRPNVTGDGTTDMTLIALLSKL